MFYVILIVIEGDWMWHGKVVSTFGCHSEGPRFDYQPGQDVVTSPTRRISSLAHIRMLDSYILQTINFSCLSLIIKNNNKSHSWTYINSKIKPQDVQVGNKNLNATTGDLNTFKKYNEKLF